MANHLTYKGWTIQERFELKIQKTDLCWEWLGSKNPGGYTQFYFDGKKLWGHVMSYKLYKGDIPRGVEVCHSCDNPSCVNPDHLWLGTHQDNMQDMFKKGRRQRGYQKDTIHPGQKLTKADKQKIIQEIKAGAKHADLALKYGVGRQTISGLKKKEYLYAE